MNDHSGESHVVKDTAVWSGLWLEGIVSTVASASGGRVDVEVVRSRFPDVACLVVDSDDRALLVRRHHVTLDRWVWELPLGSLARHEDVISAAKRTVTETCGWTVTGGRHVDTWALWPQHTNHIRHLIIARAARNVPGRDSRRAAATSWVGRSQLQTVTGDVRDIFTFAVLVWWAMGSMTALEAS
jgi:ADP-ribose pyrophosphatase YjhB (NUDIX family)